MQVVTKYQSNDGRLWDTAQQARDRDELIEKVAAAMMSLPPIPAGLDFVNGDGYVQHDPAKVLEAKQNLIELSRPFIGEWMERQTHPLTDIHPSWFCRLLDGGHPQLENAWSRLYCITADGREYGQPFYAANPDKANGDCIADYRELAQAEPD